MSEPLHLKYRPETLNEVIGQDAVVKSLARLLKERSHHSFLFTGPSGCGKTTLARIVMQEMGCDEVNLREIDAATHTGIDAMREITSTLSYSPMGGAAARGIIIDEAHALSKAAWQALLKIVEEPPAHAFWAFCTTEPAKVPPTIRTRCASYELSSVSTDDIFDLCVGVMESEGVKVSEDIIDLVAGSCEGSPRQALSSLAQVMHCKSPSEAQRVLKRAVEGDPAVVKLCREITSGSTNWAQYMKLVEPLKDMNSESVRIQVVSYLAKVAMGAKGERAAGAMNAVEAFADPYPQVVGVYPLLRSIAQICFQ